jgi:hypothetical protein
MKTLIYATVLFLTFNSLYAQELPHSNSATDKENSSYEFSLTSLDFAKKDSVDSGLSVDLTGVSLNLTSKESTYEKFRVTLAHNLFKSASALLENVNPTKTALYAQLNFRF